MRRQLYAIVATALLAFALNASLTALFPVIPSVHDEFSYLLAADSFRGGKLAQPTPAAPEHFQSPHINVVPSRHSAYMPGHGAFLAVGWLLAGDPICGSWILAAFLAAAVTWALLGAVSVRWALVGGVLSSFHPGIAVYWNQTFFGGTLAACGGALVLGALLRMAKRPHLSHGIALSVGVVCVVFSRPYTGMLISVFVAAIGMRLWWHSQAETRVDLLRNVLLPVSLTGIMSLGFVAYYNNSLTGDPLQLPYALNAEAHGAPPVFVFRNLPSRAEIPDSIAIYERMRAEDYESKRTPGGFASLTAQWVLRLARFFLASGLLLIPLLGIRAAWRIQLTRYLFWVLLGLGVALLPVKSVNPQYAGVGVGAFLLLTVLSARELMRWRWGRWLMGAGLAVLIASPFLVSWERQSRLQGAWHHRRAEIVDELSLGQSQHIVLVSYDHRHDPYAEWVHNEADLASAKILWVRSLGAQNDRELLTSYPNRQVWYLHADDPRPELKR